MKNILLYTFLFLVSFKLYGQNSTLIQPDRVSLPKMTTTIKNALVNKTEGMMVYDSDLKQFSYWTGTAWVNFGNTPASSAGWDLSGNDISTTNTGNVGVGLLPIKAKFEVSSPFTTQAIFGSNDNGISLQKNFPTIGFNQYRDNANVQKYLGTGFAGGNFLYPLNGYFYWNSIPYGNAGSNTAAENNVMTLTTSGRIGIRGVTEPNADFQTSNLLGNKINLWNDGPNNQYGIGIRNNTLALYSAHPTNLISFGHGSANVFTETVKIESGNGGIYSSQTPGLNMVPLGIARVWAKESLNGLDFESGHENIVGNLVVDHFAYGDINLDDNLIGEFKLNPAIVSQYSKIIAIGSLNYTGGSATDLIVNTAVSGFIGELRDDVLVYNSGPDPGSFYTISIVVDDFPLTLGSTLSSKVIFYGIK